MEKLDMTLGDFFLSRYKGCLLENRLNEEVKDGSIMEMIPPIRREMCGNQLRFLFKEKISLEEIKEALKEYYKNIGFRSSVMISNLYGKSHIKNWKRISGDIWFSGEHLTIQAGFEKENEDIFSLSYADAIS